MIMALIVDPFGQDHISPHCMAGGCSIVASEEMKYACTKVAQNLKFKIHDRIAILYILNLCLWSLFRLLLTKIMEFCR